MQPAPWITRVGVLRLTILPVRSKPATVTGTCAETQQAGFAMAVHESNT